MGGEYIFTTHTRKATTMLSIVDITPDKPFVNSPTSEYKTIYDLKREDFPDTLIYDGETIDGFTAAFCAYTALEIALKLMPNLAHEFKHRPINFIGNNYDKEDATFNGNVLILGGSINPALCVKLVQVANTDSITCVDSNPYAKAMFIEHQPLHEMREASFNMLSYNPVLGGVYGCFDTTVGNASLAFDWFIKPLIELITNTVNKIQAVRAFTGFNASHEPDIYVGIRNLCEYVDDWSNRRFERHNSRYFHAYAMSFNWTFDIWKKLTVLMANNGDAKGTPNGEIVEKGRIIFYSKLRLIESMLRGKPGLQTRIIGDVRIYRKSITVHCMCMCNVPQELMDLLADYLLRDYSSNSYMVGIVAIKNDTNWTFYSRAYCDMFDRSARHRVDVSILAKEFGGGGLPTFAKALGSLITIDDLFTTVEAMLKSGLLVVEKLAPPQVVNTSDINTYLAKAVDEFPSNFKHTGRPLSFGKKQQSGECAEKMYPSKNTAEADDTEPTQIVDTQTIE